MFEINKENYKEYIELYNAHCLSKKEANKVYENTLLTALITICAFVFTISFSIPNTLCSILFIPTIGLPAFVGYKTFSGIIINKREELLKKYPNINIKISIFELEDALKKANILTQKMIDGDYYEILSVSEYEEILKQEEKIQDVQEQKSNKLEVFDHDDFIKCEEIKKQVLEENRYDIYTDYSITSEELETVKEKVKTLVKK